MPPSPAQLRGKRGQDFKGFAPPLPKRGSQSAARRGNFCPVKRLLLVLVVLLLLAASAASSSPQRPGPRPRRRAAAEVELEVPRGANARSVGAQLQKAGPHRRHPRLPLRGVEARRPLAQGRQVQALALALAHGAGRRAREAAPRRRRALRGGGGLAPSRHRRGAGRRGPRRRRARTSRPPRSRQGYTAPFTLPDGTLEGYLYPETYLLPKGRIDPRVLVQKQLDQFAARVFTPLRGRGEGLQALAARAGHHGLDARARGAHALEPPAGRRHPVEAHRPRLPPGRRRHQPLRAQGVERSRGVPGEAARRERSVQHAPQEGPAAHAHRRAHATRRSRPRCGRRPATSCTTCTTHRSSCTPRATRRSTRRCARSSTSTDAAPKRTGTEKQREAASGGNGAALSTTQPRAAASSSSAPLDCGDGACEAAPPVASVQNESCTVPRCWKRRAAAG